jgi:hypothetical protein
MYNSENVALDTGVTRRAIADSPRETQTGQKLFDLRFHLSGAF